jgi:hypothetical protein
MTTLRIECPSCHGILFDSPADFKSEKDLAGKTCNGCGYVLTHEDIKRQIETYAAARVEKILKGEGS